MILKPARSTLPLTPSRQREGEQTARLPASASPAGLSLPLPPAGEARSRPRRRSGEGGSKANGVIAMIRNRLVPPSP